MHSFPIWNIITVWSSVVWAMIHDLWLCAEVNRDWLKTASLQYVKIMQDIATGNTGAMVPKGVMHNVKLQPKPPPPSYKCYTTMTNYSWNPNKRTGPLVKTSGKILGRPANWHSSPKNCKKNPRKNRPERHFTRHRESAVNISRISFPMLHNGMRNIKNSYR